MHIGKVHIPNKALKIAGIVISILLLAAIAAGAYAYSKRDALLHRAVEKAVAKARTDYDLQLKIGSYGFSGLKSVYLHNVSAVPQGHDTLMRAQNLEVAIKLWPLLTGNISLARLNISNAALTVVFNKNGSNVDFLLKRKKKDNTTSTKRSYATIAHNLMRQVLTKIPEDMDMQNFLFSVNEQDTASLYFHTAKSTIINGRLNSTWSVNKGAATWHATGYLNPGNEELNLRVYAQRGSLSLPYLEKKLHTTFSADTIETALKNAGYHGDDYKISASWYMRNFTFYQKRIADNNISIPLTRVNADMLFGDDYIALDSTSTVYINQATFHPFIKYTVRPHAIYQLGVHAARQNAQALFSAFPQGMFESLEGIKVAGELKYDFDLSLDSKLPDSVQMYSAMTPYNFKILQFGAVNLQKINGPFVYTPYEGDKKMRDILIGPGNPDYTPLSQISPNLINSVLTSEDPSFRTHKGFVEKSIRRSIAVNFKEKRFKQGGSTISMQLVKNVFLSRKKTIARKVEEMLIVWLIENNNLISKSRMLEVYFNIIELGRNIYGIGEASRYYFAKSPANLTIGEAIFFSNIIPKPKIAMLKFAPGGGLRGYLHGYFNFIGNIMANRGLTPRDTAAYGFYNVRVREGLRIAVPKDTSSVDTNLADDGDIDMPVHMQDENKNLFDRIFGRKRTDSTSKRTRQNDTAQAPAQPKRKVKWDENVYPE